MANLTPFLTKNSSKFTMNDSNLEIWVKSPGVGGWAHKFGLIDPNKTFFEQNKQQLQPTGVENGVLSGQVLMFRVSTAQFLIFNFGRLGVPKYAIHWLNVLRLSFSLKSEITTLAVWGQMPAKMVHGIVTQIHFYFFLHPPPPLLPR